MKQKITVLILLIGLSTIAQTKFEKGYILKKDNKKINCLIKNEDLLSTPLSFKYKLSENNKVITILENEIKKLEIYNKVAFERQLVDIDRDINYSDKHRRPKYKKESILLEILVDGKARLFQYNNNSINHFYFMIDSSIIMPLEYKVFKMKKYLGRNLNYQKTLKEKLSCKKGELNSNIRYKKSDLTKYFTKYNICTGSFNKTYGKETKKGKLNIYIKSGLAYVKIRNSFQNKLFKPASDSDSQIIYKIGMEFEYILPFNNSKWSVFIEPTFSSNISYKKDVFIKYIKINSNPALVPKYDTVSVNYNSIDFPIGLRHYIFFNDNSKVFLNAGYNFNIPLTNKITYENILIKTEKRNNYFLFIPYLYFNSSQL